MSFSNTANLWKQNELRRLAKVLTIARLTNDTATAEKAKKSIQTLREMNVVHI